MKSIIAKLSKIISIFHPKSIYRLVEMVHFKLNQPDRTSELIDIIQNKDYHSFLEVGVFLGQNIVKIAKKFPYIECYGVDPYDYKEYENQLSFKDGNSIYLKTESENVFKKALANSEKLENFHLIRKSSFDAAKMFDDNSIDLIFIDANHSYESVKNDIDLWLPKVKKGGWLSGHDYHINYFGVILAVNEKLGVDNIAIRSDATWFYYKD